MLLAGGKSRSTCKQVKRLHGGLLAWDPYGKLSVLFKAVIKLNRKICYDTNI